MEIERKMILRGLIIPIITFIIITAIVIITSHSLIHYILVWNIEGIKFGTVFFVISSISLIVMTHITIKNRRLLFH